MHLREYLERSGLTPADFAESIGRDPTTVTKIVAGRFTTRETMQRIYEATGGAVTPNDLLGIVPAAPRPSALGRLSRALRAWL